MKLAIIENNQVTKTGSYKELFPNVSFPSTGPDDEFLVTNSAVKVIEDFIVPNPELNKLESCEPYLEAGQVFSVKVVPKTQADIDKELANNIAKSKSELEYRLAAFRFEKDIDMEELDTLLSSNIPEWVAEAQCFKRLYLASWEAFYNGEPLPILSWG